MPPADKRHRDLSDEQPDLQRTRSASTPPEPIADTLPPPEPSLDRTVAALEQLRPGQMLGQYQIVEHLGSGGMGQVFKALHPAMQRMVALKVIAPQLTQDAQTRKRFQREVHSAARLIHPNVVVAYDASEFAGLSFLVMEYVPGTDAAHLFLRHGRPPVALACEIARQAALGLQHAHELGMVHRDIKPANLMVAQALGGSSLSREQPLPGWPNPPLVKILDFGLARLASGGESGGADVSADMTRQGSVLGTPAYMAPEQAKDSRLADIRSDIYSLGCTLYSLLAGRPPFVCASAFETIAMHMSQAPEPVSKHCPMVPARLEQVIMRTLAKEPAVRYATPLELANALQPWATGIGMLPAENKIAGGNPATNPGGTQRPASSLPPRQPAFVLGDVTAFLKLMFIVAVLGLASVFVYEYWPKIVEAFESISHRTGKPDSPRSPPAGKKGTSPQNIE